MNPICCLNPNCDNPSVPDTNRLCPQCQKPLVLLRHRYRPVKSLGQGGFGKTYLAMDNDKFGEKCVIKQLAPQAGSTAAVQKAQQLFEQEAQQLKKLKHLQIPDLKAYFCEGSYFYFVQDFIEGDNLLGELKRGIFDEQKIIKFLNELLPVLKYIHDRGIIHRDIKPENMMRRSDGFLFLIDFGVSKQLQGTILTGTSIGTFGYAPLEQMQDGKVYPASDLFSVGATCFHLLTGIHPWEVWRLKGYGWVQEWRQHLKKPVSSQFGTVLDKLLALYPEHRYQWAEDVLKAFNSSQAKQSPSPPPTTPSVVLESEVDVDYSQLQKLLSEGEWEEADLETALVMCKAANRESQGWLDEEIIQKFPCADLRTIDQLWVKYSDGRFGFSVQKRIYVECGANLDGSYPGDEIWEKFENSVGWTFRVVVGINFENLNQQQIIYKQEIISAPQGHLPYFFNKKEVMINRGAWVLFSRAANCNL